MPDFWEGKIPCWEMSRCSPLICHECPAYRDRTRPCWETEGTLCDKILGTPKTCDLCHVYRAYGPQGTDSRPPNGSPSPQEPDTN